MKPASQVTAERLADLPGFGVIGGVDPASIYIGREPEHGPATVITCYDTGGPSPLLTPKRGATVIFSQPTVQVRVRAESYPEAYELAHQAHDLFARLPSFTEDGYTYEWHPQGSPVPIGRDERERSLFVINFRLQLRQGDTP